MGDALVTGVVDYAGGQFSTALPACSFLVRQILGGAPEQACGAGYFALGGGGPVEGPK
jgi:hypothetical protein